MWGGWSERMRTTDRSHRVVLLRNFPLYVFIIISTSLCHHTIAFATHSTSRHHLIRERTTSGRRRSRSSAIVTNQAGASSSSTSSEELAATLSSASNNNNNKNDKVTTLTKETTWRLRILLNGITTTKGRKLSSSNSGSGGGGQLFVVEGSFIEEDGYEPPQGYFQPLTAATTINIIDDVDENAISSTTTTSKLEIMNSRWKLSEDPDDPKDGLWIWGLFKEPLYPYMLLQMETHELALSSSKDGLNDDSIPPLKLYAQISHIRTNNNNNDKNKNKDALIGGGRRGGEGVELKTANLNIRVLEQIALPGTTVDVYEEEAVGQITFQPLL